MVRKLEIPTERGTVICMGDGVADNVWSGPKISILRLKEILYHSNNSKTNKNTVLYVNGLFVPFWFYGFARKEKVVLVPRGMCAPQALRLKRWKKELFILCFKLLKIHERVVFHTTSEQEKKDVLQLFGKQALVYQIPNVPYHNFTVKRALKNKGELNILSSAQIGPLKNQIFINKVLSQVKGVIKWTLAGKILDEQYYLDLKKAMEKLPGNVEVSILGEIPFPEVENQMKNHHVAFLPSVTENFGHAHFEALVAGLPLFTSTNVPWTDLLPNMAGVNMDISEIQPWVESLNLFVNMDDEQMKKWSECAVKYAQSRVNLAQLRHKYLEMFFG